jgi:hypothetical protein
MSHHIDLSDEEMAELEKMLRYHLTEARSELHWTDNYQYKDVVRHNILVLERMLEAVTKSAAVV